MRPISDIILTQVPGELAEHKHGAGLAAEQLPDDRRLFDQTVPVHVHCLQTETHLSKVEQVPWDKASLEG